MGTNYFTHLKNFKINCPPLTDPFVKIPFKFESFVTVSGNENKRKSGLSWFKVSVFYIYKNKFLSGWNQILQDELAVSKIWRRKILFLWGDCFLWNSYCFCCPCLDIYMLYCLLRGLWVLLLNDLFCIIVLFKNSDEYYA